MRRVYEATDARRRLRRIERLAWLLDQSLWIGKWRFGIDPLLGLIPGVGDAIGTLLSLYVLYEGARLGMPGLVLMRMTANILLETVVGAVPVLGDLFDFAWRANTRNLALIRRHYRPNAQPRSLGWIWAALLSIAVVMLGLVVALSYFVVRAILLALNH